MKITILSPVYPFRGGIANFTNILASELLKNNDIQIITFKRQYPELLFPGKTQYEISQNKLNIKSSQLVDSINPLNWFNVGRKVKSDKPDILIFSFWMPFFAPAFGTIAKIVKKNNHTKILSICHNVIPHETKPGDLSFTKYFFSKVDYFVLLSQKVKSDLLKIKPAAKFKVLFHPVYSSFGEPVNKKAAKEHLNLNYPKIILFFGLVREYKGLDILLKAMNLIKQNPDVKLVIAGEFYQEKIIYDNLIKKYQISESIFIIDKFIDSEEVKYYFSAADAVILPYKDATQSGIVQVAVNFGKPLIGSNVGGLGEIIKNGYNGYLVEKNNPEELANAIEKFYAEDKETEFTQNIKKEADKYSWTKFVNELMILIREK